MLKGLSTVLLICAVALPTAALSRNTNVKLVEYQSPLLPPANYRGQWWMSPDNCQYSRAGRPGETVWYLIVNSAHGKCPSRLIQRAYSDYN
jgi:hypothetical protein